jgi:hypothetical protein
VRNFILAIAALSAFAANAQQVWRCGNTYSQAPCPDGVPFVAADPRTAAEASKADRVTQADQQRADAMEKARLDQEKKAPKAQVMGAPRAPASAPKVDKKPAKKAGKKEPEHFTAVGPKPAKN